jgi:hypothetical protein
MCAESSASESAGSIASGRSRRTAAGISANSCSIESTPIVASI